MATRSTIAVQHPDGKISQIYCHWDGYLEHNGSILAKHYDFLERVEEMVSLGDMSSLAKYVKPDIGAIHSFDYPQKYVCVYYGRDRGETGTHPRLFKDYKDFKQNMQHEEYDYLFRNGKWYYYEKYCSKRFSPIPKKYYTPVE